MTSGTYSFLSFNLSVTYVASLVALLVITQFSDQVKIRLISQLINSISSVLQKFLKCFNGTTILTFFSILILSNLPVMLVL